MMSNGQMNLEKWHKGCNDIYKMRSNLQKKYENEITISKLYTKGATKL